MNEGHKGLRYSRLWFVLVSAVFLILLIATQFLLGGRRSFWDWLPAVIFLLIVSVVGVSAVFGGWQLVRWMFRRRNLKWSLFAWSGIVILIGLVWLESHWPGRDSWNRSNND